MYGIDISNFVPHFNKAFYSIVIISAIFLIGLTAAMVYFIIKYNRKKNKVATQIEGSLTLEILWTVIPILLALLMFHYGWIGWKPTTSPPEDAMEVTSIARMWSFNFVYPNGKNSPDLVLPVNKPVKIDLVSQDVNHSISIPEFRIKQDIVPGRKRRMWFQPQQEGEYDLYCSEYCGLRHSYMNAVVRVLPVEEFEKWYKETTVTAPVEGAEAAAGAAGMEIIRAQGCIACHSTDGSKIVGPSFLGLYGKTETVVRDGKDVSITADDEYIRRSIYEPNIEITKGYQPGLMQSYKGIINDDDMAKIIEYLKNLE